MVLLFFEVAYAFASFSAAITPFDNWKLPTIPSFQSLKWILYLPVERIPHVKHSSFNVPLWMQGTWKWAVLGRWSVVLPLWLDYDYYQDFLLLPDGVGGRIEWCICWSDDVPWWSLAGENLFLGELVRCWLWVVGCLWGTQNTWQLFLCPFLERLCMLLQTQCFFNVTEHVMMNIHCNLMLVVVSICFDDVRLIVVIVGYVYLIVSRWEVSTGYESLYAVFSMQVV